jgi:hypothetical protein
MTSVVLRMLKCLWVEIFGGKSRSRNEMKSEKYHTVRTVTKSKINLAQGGKVDTPAIHNYVLCDCILLAWYRHKKEDMILTTENVHGQLWHSVMVNQVIVATRWWNNMHSRRDFQSTNMYLGITHYSMNAGNTMSTNLKVSNYIHCSQHYTQLFRDMFI